MATESNVKQGERYMDFRSGKRIVKVIQLEVGGKALCENEASGRRTRIDVVILETRYRKQP